MKQFLCLILVIFLCSSLIECQTTYTKCTMNENCPSGSVCSGGLCKLSFGQPCNGYDSCRTGLKCQGGVCKIIYGFTCSNYPNLCADDMICLNEVCDNDFSMLG